MSWSKLRLMAVSSTTYSSGSISSALRLRLILIPAKSTYNIYMVQRGPNYCSRASHFPQRCLVSEYSFRFLPLCHSILFEVQNGVVVVRTHEKQLATDQIWEWSASQTSRLIEQEHQRTLVALQRSHTRLLFQASEELTVERRQGFYGYFRLADE